MGRTTIYRTDVEKARKALIARGIHPSGDAVRVELGNTGSKSTIHKYLRQIEGDEHVDGDQEKVLGNEIGELVSTLAARLKHEADARVAEARTACDAQLTQSAALLAQEKAETARLVASLERAETAFEKEKATHRETSDQLHVARVTIGQLEERILGLQTRIDEHEAHAKSLESKHDQARQALEHFRATAKEQREREQGRHEHQVQGLQAELRNAAGMLAAKNDEVLKLNRDNARLAEQVGRQDKEINSTRVEVRDRDHELKALRPIIADHKALQTRCLQAENRLEAANTELSAARQELALERAARARAETAAVRTADQDASMQALLARLATAVEGDRAARSASATSSQ